MHENIRAKVMQRLERLPDDTARQLLDYIEFLESKYNRSTRDRSALERLAENVEGTLRASRIGGAAIRGTAQVLDAASSVVRGMADAGRVVVEELQRLDVSEDAKGKGQPASEQAQEGESRKPDGGGERPPETAAQTEVVSAADDVSPQEARKGDRSSESPSPE